MIGAISYIFYTFIYQPLLNLLVLLYLYLPFKDFGIAVIVLTVLIKFLLYPINARAIKSQKVITEIQPQIKEIQEKFKDNKEKQVEETLAVYKKAKISPFSSFVPLLIQLPVLIALYRIFWQGLQPETMSYLYGFVSHPGEINPLFLGFLNLSLPSSFLAFFAGIAQYFQSKTMMPQKKKSKSPDMSDAMQKQMLYFFPVFTFFILLRIPAVVGLYWLTTMSFSVIQQRLILKKKDN